MAIAAGCLYEDKSGGKIVPTVGELKSRESKITSKSSMNTIQLTSLAATSAKRKRPTADMIESDDDEDDLYGDDNDGDEGMEDVKPVPEHIHTEEVNTKPDVIKKRSRVYCFLHTETGAIEVFFSYYIFILIELQS
jgi:hypothetical protein